MKRNMEQLLVLAGVIMLGADSVAACGGSGGSETKAVAAKETEVKETEVMKAVEAVADSTPGLKPLAKGETLSIGFFAGSTHSIPWCMADKMELFDEPDIDVEYQSFTGGPVIMETSADWDVCDVGGPDVSNGMKNYGMNMTGICDNEFNTGLFIHPDTDLVKDATNPEVWRDKKVLLNKGTTLQYMLMRYTVSIGTEDLEAYDIEIIDAMVRTCLAASQTSEGDALCVWSALAVTAKLDGNVCVTDIGKVNLDNISGVCATSNVIENKVDLTSTAYRACYKTWEWCKTSEKNMAKAEELLMESCDDEGVTVTEEIVARLIAEFQYATLDEAAAATIGEEADHNGKGGDVSPATDQLFEILDLFITLGNYTEEDRQAILDRGLVNPAIVNAIKQFQTLQGYIRSIGAPSVFKEV